MFALSLRQALLLTSLAFAAVTQASSFDCASAASKTERAICADPDLSRLDEQLAERWRSTLANVPDPKALKTDQRQWLKSRNACGDLTACLRSQTPHVANKTPRISPTRGVTTTPSSTIRVIVCAAV